MSGVNANIQGLRQTPVARETTRPAGTGTANQSLFRDQLSALTQTPNQRPGAQAPAAAPALKFSNHAVDRMRSRGIRFTPEDLARIENGVAKAEAKGARNTLLLTDEAAMIVSIKDKTVVTVMDKTQLKENVFTNIDSTIMV